jgi:hypothetical protein
MVLPPWGERPPGRLTGGPSTVAETGSSGLEAFDAYVNDAPAAPVADWASVLFSGDYGCFESNADVRS